MSGFLGRFLHLWAGLTVGWAWDAHAAGRGEFAIWLAFSALSAVFVGDVLLRYWARAR